MQIICDGSSLASWRVCHVLSNKLITYNIIPVIPERLSRGIISNSTPTFQLCRNPMNRVSDYCLQLDINPDSLEDTDDKNFGCVN